MDCVFCKILSGELPASVVFEDDLVSALLDIQPVNPGHTLVIPNQHAELFADLAPEMLGRMMAIAQRVAEALRASDLRCDGVNLFLADGTVAGQEVPHVHLHVIPRYAGDGFGLRFGADYMKLPTRQMLDEAAATLRASLPHC